MIELMKQMPRHANRLVSVQYDRRIVIGEPSRRCQRLVANPLFESAAVINPQRGSLEIPLAHANNAHLHRYASHRAEFSKVDQLLNGLI